MKVMIVWYARIDRWCSVELITEFVTRLTRRVPLVEQELLIFPSTWVPPTGFYWGSCYSIFSFVDRCLSFRTFYFGHCVVCSSIYIFSQINRQDVSEILLKVALSTTISTLSLAVFIPDSLVSVVEHVANLHDLCDI